MWNFKKIFMLHNFESSLTIIIDDRDQYFKKKIIFRSKILVMTLVKF